MEICYHCFQCMCTTTSTSDGGVSTTTTTCTFSCCFDYIKNGFTTQSKVEASHNSHPLDK